MKQIFAILIGFLHDFATGCWAATVFAVYWLDRQNFTVDLLTALLDLKKQFFYAGLFSIFLVFATGAGRSFTYTNNKYGKRHERKRRTLLIIKHLLLLTIFAVGTYWQYATIFK